jgi:hypothetical protein
MQAKVRNELRMLRELTQHFATGGHCLHDKDGHAICWFCKTRLFKQASETFGHHMHLSIRDQITVHHIDENHQNNFRTNRTLSHRSCHKSHHLRQQHKNGNINRWPAKKTLGSLSRKRESK